MSSLSSPRDYAFLNARIRGLKSKMLTISQYEKLIQASDVDEAIRLLSTTLYWNTLSKVLAPPVDMEQVDAALKHVYVNEVRSLIKNAPLKARKLLSKYQKRVYYDNIKVILKVIHSGESIDIARKHIIALTPEENAEYERLLMTQSIPQLVDRLPDLKLRKKLQDAIQKYEAIKSTILLETELDRYFYQHEIWDTIKYLTSTDKKYARDFFGTRIEILNILTVIRAKLQGLEPQLIESILIPVSHKTVSIAREVLTARNLDEVISMLSATPYRELAHRVKEAYDKSPTISSIEHAFEEYLIQTSYLSIIGFPFHIGTVLAYLDLKYYELRNIKIILVGKKEGVSPTTIRELLIITP